MKIIRPNKFAFLIPVALALVVGVSTTAKAEEAAQSAPVHRLVMPYKQHLDTSRAAFQQLESRVKGHSENQATPAALFSEAEWIKRRVVDTIRPVFNRYAEALAAWNGAILVDETTRREAAALYNQCHAAQGSARAAYIAAQAVTQQANIGLSSAQKTQNAQLIGAAQTRLSNVQQVEAAAKQEWERCSGRYNQFADPNNGLLARAAAEVRRTQQGVAYWANFYNPRVAVVAQWVEHFNRLEAFMRQNPEPKLPDQLPMGPHAY